MKPKNYVEVVKKHKFTVVVVIILCGLFSLVYSFVKPQSFSSNISMSFYRVNREVTSDYQYDNYYTGKAVEILTNTVLGWLETSNIIQEVYDEAGVVSDDIYKDTKKFKPKQISAHQIEVRVVNKNKGDLDKLSAAVVSVMDERVKKLEITSDNKNSFDVVAEEPIIVEIKYNPLMLLLIGLAAGLFLGIGVAFLWEYFREEGQ